MTKSAKIPTYRKVSRDLSVLSMVLQDVAYPAQGVDEAGAVIPVQLVPQLVDEDLDDVAFPVEGVAPDVLGDQRLREDAALVPEQVLQERELARRQLDLRLAPEDLPLEEVHPQVRAGEHDGLRRPVPPQERPDPGLEFLDGE